MSTKETKIRVRNAFNAMKALGINEIKVKPVLKSLLKLYDKNWELIEEENYRALADAIFEKEEADAEVAEHSKKNMDSEAAEHSKKTVSNEEFEERTQATEESPRPLKRLRRKYQDGQSSSPAAPSPSGPRMPLLIPKDEPSELPESCTPPLNASQGAVESHQPITENTRADPQLLRKKKGKQPISPKSLVVHDPSPPTGGGSSPHKMMLRDRGNGSVPPQIISKGKRCVPESSPNAACPNETTVEADTVHKRKSIAKQQLLVPKDEPVTDDMPDLAVPLAVTHPDPSTGGDSSDRNGTIREDNDSLEPSVEKERTDGTIIQNGATSNGELAVTSDQRSSIIEIASSPSGEVKLSFSCDLALAKHDFEMPSIETVIKLVEDKCNRSYKSFDPNFSVMDLMKEMCQCFLNLKSGSSSEAPVTMDATPNTDMLIKSSAMDTFDARGQLSSSFSLQVDAEATLPKASVVTPCDGIADGSHLKKRVGEDDSKMDIENTVICAESTLPKALVVAPCDGIADGSHLNKRDDGDNNRMNIENSVICAEESNNLSLVVAHQPQVTPEMIVSLHDVFDVAKGQENVVITLVNEVNNECPPSFCYIPQNVVFQNAFVNFSLARIGNSNCCSTCFGDCLSLSTPCTCSHEIVGEFAYTIDGLVKEELLEQYISMNLDQKKRCQFFCKECPLERSRSEDYVEPCKGHLVRKFIKECWWKCGCTKQCGNRVVQRGVTRNLQVFMTPEGKGWGLRTVEDLPKGAFVCEYVGEVLTNAELFDRVSRSPKGKKHSYPVLLDAGWGDKEVLKDEEALCLDSTNCGNVSRFINHRCYDSNLVEIPVEVETPEHHYYRVALFTTREVKAMEELTWDYGIDFDDQDHPIKAFDCQCGSKFCRNMKRSRSRAARRALLC
ncbi:hypothetical protein ACS0TY_025799 [Phlomoides rotata]